jgi:hypothetical protein
MVEKHLTQFGQDYARHFAAAVPEPVGLAFFGTVAAMALTTRRCKRSC